MLNQQACLATLMCWSHCSMVMVTQPNASACTFLVRIACLQAPRHTCAVVSHLLETQRPVDMSLLKQESVCVVWAMLFPQLFILLTCNANWMRTTGLGIHSLGLVARFKLHCTSIVVAQASFSTTKNQLNNCIFKKPLTSHHGKFRLHIGNSKALY